MVATRGERKSGGGWLIWLLLLVLSALTVWWLAATREVAGEQEGDVAAADVAGVGATAPPAAGWAAAAG